MSDSHSISDLLKNALRQIPEPEGYKEMRQALLRIQPKGPRPNVYESPENTRSYPKGK
jgi:hypothetical protein